MNLLFTLSILFGIYILFGLYLYLFQQSYLYFPDNTDFDSCANFLEAEKIHHKGTRIYYKKNSEKLAVVYHGNYGSACDRVFWKNVLEEKNYSYAIVEYAGFSNDTRKSSKELIYQDVRNAIDFLSTTRHDELVVIGESIGTAPASYHASLANVDKLVLVAPFSTMQELAQEQYPIYPAGLILRDKYDNAENLRDFQGKVMILHGDSDNIIRKRHSQKLYESIKTEKDYIILNDRGHNDIFSSPEFLAQVKKFL